jgi:hypothetical protein
MCHTFSNASKRQLEQEVLEITNRLLSFDTTRTVQKTPPTILRCRGNVFTELLPSNDRGIHRQTHRLSFDKTRTVQKMRRPTISIDACIRCGKNVFTKSLNTTERTGTLNWAVALQRQEEYTYTHTDYGEGFMKYAAEMGSVGMI